MPRDLRLNQVVQIDKKDKDGVTLDAVTRKNLTVSNIKL